MPSTGMLRRVALVKNQRFGGTYHHNHQGDKYRRTRNNVSSYQQQEFLRSLLRLLVTANVVPSSQILVTLIMEAILSYETSVLIRATRRNIPADSILHSHRRETLNLTQN
jgi:radical SAM superfamily enzyme with C-terminal helix-hairpin-helix motif